MADTLTALIQALLKKKQAQPAPAATPDPDIDPERPWDSPVLRAAVPAVTPTPAPTPAPTPTAAPSPGEQAINIEEALALAEKIKRQKALAASLIPEQSWNK